MGWKRIDRKGYIQHNNMKILANFGRVEIDCEMYEVNLVSWYDKLPKVDIRPWYQGNPRKGFCMPIDGFERFREMINSCDLTNIKDIPDIEELKDEDDI